MIAYVIVLAIALLWSFAAGSGAFREAPPAFSRRTATLRDAARKQFGSGATLETFRDPRRSPIIFASQHWHQRWWCEKLDVTADALRAAMREVGPMTADVERYLAPQRAE
jgi:hypothetical protein